MKPKHQDNAVIHHQVQLMEPAPQDPPCRQYRSMNVSRADERMGELVSRAEARPLSNIEQEALAHSYDAESFQAIVHGIINLYYQVFAFASTRFTKLLSQP